MIAKTGIIAALLLAGLAAPALADAHMRCFTMAQMGNWRSDGKTIYFRAGVNRYYKLELARECSTLKGIDPRLLITSRTGGTVCTALDLDVKAGESPGGIVEPCFPRTLSELTPAEAAALPKDVKP